MSDALTAPQTLNAEGIALLGRDDRRAADLFSEAIAADPGVPTLWLNLATACRNLRRDDDERRALEGALALDQAHLMANIRLAELLGRIGQAEAASFRWRGVATILQATPERSPALDQLLRKALEYVERHNASTAERTDAAMADARSTFGPVATRRFDACVDAMLGRRAIYAPAPHGLHFPFLPAEEFFPRELFDWLAALEAQTPAIVAELRHLLRADDPGFAPYVSMTPGSPTNIWSPLDNSSKWSARYLWKYGRRDEALCAACPATAAALDAVPMFDLPGRSPSAFFSVLQPGTALPPHTGVSNVRCTLHLPLIVPSDCGFRVGGATREWRVGEAFVFDDTIEHEAWNRSGSIRAVMIVDVWNPYLTDCERDLLRRLFAVLPTDDAATAVND